MISDFHNDVLTAPGCGELISEYGSSDNYVVCAYYKGKRSFADAFSAARSFVSAKPDNLFLAFEDISYTDDLNVLGALFDISPVYVSLTWNDANVFGGGAGSTGGLTELGRRLIADLNERGIAVDLAHANERTFFEALEIAERPVCSHACFSAVNPHYRNLTEEEVYALVDKNGLIGLTFYRPFVSGRAACGAREVAEHVDWFCSRFPSDLLAIGSDFNGADSFPDGMGDYGFGDILRAELEKRGHKDGVIDKILFSNLKNFLAASKV